MNGDPLPGTLSFESVPQNRVVGPNDASVVAVRALYNDGDLPDGSRIVDLNGNDPAPLGAFSTLAIGESIVQLGGSDFSPMQFGELPAFAKNWRMFPFRSAFKFELDTGIFGSVDDIRFPRDDIKDFNRNLSWWNAAVDFIASLKSTPLDTIYPIVPPSSAGAGDGTRFGFHAQDYGGPFEISEIVTAAGDGSGVIFEPIKSVLNSYQAFPIGWYNAVPVDSIVEVFVEFEAQPDIAYALLSARLGDRLEDNSPVTVLSSASEVSPIWGTLDFMSTGEVIAAESNVVTVQQQSRWRISRRQNQPLSVLSTMFDDKGTAWNIVSVDEDTRRGELILNCERTV